VTRLATSFEARLNAVRNIPLTAYRGVAKILSAKQDEVLITPVQQPLNSIMYTEGKSFAGAGQRDYFLIIEHCAEHTRLYPFSQAPFLTPGQRVYADADWDSIYIGPHLIGEAVDILGRDGHADLSGARRFDWVDKPSRLFPEEADTFVDDEDEISVPETVVDSLKLKFGSWAIFGENLKFREQDYALATSQDFDVIIVVSAKNELPDLSAPEKGDIFGRKVARHIHIKPPKRAKHIEVAVAESTALAFAQAFAQRGYDVSMIVDITVGQSADNFMIGDTRYTSPFPELDLINFCGLYGDGSITGFLRADLALGHL